MNNIKLCGILYQRKKKKKKEDTLQSPPNKLPELYALC